jgi:L-fuconolactonase
MPKIDAHQHFWKYDPQVYSWISEDMQALRQDLLPQHLLPLLEQHNFDGCIAIQADQSETETLFLLDNAAQNSFIFGVVGWVDLKADNLQERLLYFKKFDRLKGFRHVLQDEADRAYMLQPEFIQGIARLQPFGFTYDILIHADQLKFIPEFLDHFPGQPFVLDHIAKPDIKNGSITDWKKEIQALAKYENLFCKVSGMVTEADWNNWKQDDFTPYLDVVFQTFSIERLMFGSDWPVSTLAANYDQTVGIIENYMRQFSSHDQALFWGGNAARFYKLNQ